ncbi:MraY family glycosyltransferase [Anaeromyxobacter paludicola]|uniref:Undecaprenyl/decaprenyl-phosphate alpha-N-acetylglucosaminyl 1-phosphate transferase n=1 Tax=Anaeromyxobacter paludicola TaxID=2918171 RepID=A0ABM7XCN3_9BACT|nr:MraY family glycosyltransferase [Anaeromyxobacter paludicola]BDG09634.1 hypothetical protein AMPC_27470 [Anaeromyxobacter paludicola]
MKTAAIAFSLSAATSAWLTPVVGAAAHRYGFLDHALSSRKIHGRPIPRLGGIAIVVAFYAPLLALLLVHGSGVGARFWGDLPHALGLFLGGAVIAALGVYDDLFGAGARLKFAVQFGVAALMYAFGFRIDAIAVPLLHTVSVGWLGLPLTMLWIAGVINALNLIDGLDGLAGGTALIAVVATFVEATSRGNALMMLFMGALGGAILGFLRYNLNPARIFMGDTGSMFLGFVLAVSSIQTAHKSSAAVALAIPVVALGLPIADTLLAMARRAVRGVPLFAADRDHIHHRLLERGLTQKQAVRALWAASALLGCSAVALTRLSGVAAAAFLVGVAATFVLGLRRLGYLRMSCPRDLLERRRRNVMTLQAIREVGERLARADRGEDVWVAVCAAAPVLGVSCVALRRGGPAGANQPIVSDGFQEAGPAPFVARFSLRPERPGGDELELGWRDGRRKLSRDTEIAVELLCGYLHDALDRFDPDVPLAPARHEPGRSRLAS